MMVMSRYLANKKGQERNSLALDMNLIKRNVSDDFLCVFYSQNNIGTRQMLKPLIIRALLPYLFSFVFNNYNSPYQESKSQQDNACLKEQGQVFKEIASQSDGKNCFAQVAKIFGNKFFCFFFKDKTHSKLLSVVRYGERQKKGEISAGNGTEINIFGIITKYAGLSI